MIKENTKSKDDECTITPVKSVGISISKDFITTTITDFNDKNNLNWTVDEYIQNINDGRIRDYLYDIYVAKKHNKIMENPTNNPLIDEYNRIIDKESLTLYYVEYDMTKLKYFRETDILVHINDYLKQEFAVEREFNKIIMKIGENVRFKFTYL